MIRELPDVSRGPVPPAVLFSLGVSVTLIAIEVGDSVLVYH